MADNAAPSTSRVGARAEPEATTKKPRPKPRKKPPTGSINTATSAPPSDPAPAAATVPRVAITAALLEPIPAIELQPQHIPLTIADRAKSRTRGAKPKLVAQDVIDIPSDEDERLLRLSPHRPGKKDVRGTKNWPIPKPPSIHPSQESLVAPTSDYQLAPAISSQLPPSDPPSSTLPLPTSTPESAKKRSRVADTGDTSESPLNPSKKQWRQRAVMDDEDDTRTMPMIDQPPPSFFASSSSSLPPPPAPVGQGEPGKKKPTKRKQPAGDAPPPEVVGLEPPREKKSRPKPKKKSIVLPEPSEVGQSSTISTSVSRPRSKDPAYKSAEIIDDSDEEANLVTLPPPHHLADSQSPLSDLSEPTNPGPPKPITPSSSRKRLVPEVLITTVPRKRTSSPSVREIEERDNVDRDGVSGSPKGKKRQKKAAEENYFDGLNDELEESPKKRSKGKGKAPAKGKGRTKPQPRKVVDDEEFEEDPTEDAVGTSRKAKKKATTKATTKTKSVRSTKSRVVDSVTVDAPAKDSEVVDIDQPGDSSTALQNTNGGETPPPQNTRVSL